MKTFPVVLLCLLCLCRPAQAEIIVVFDTQHPLKNVPDNSRLIQLDAADRLLQQLSHGLPADPVRAEAVAKQQLKASGKLQQEIRNAYQDISDAWSLGVTKIPAVVVDRQYVVYGEPDVLRALDEIARFRSRR